MFSNPFNIQDLSIDILSYLHWCSTLTTVNQQLEIDMIRVNS